MEPSSAMVSPWRHRRRWCGCRARSCPRRARRPRRPKMRALPTAASGEVGVGVGAGGVQEVRRSWRCSAGWWCSRTGATPMPPLRRYERRPRRRAGKGGGGGTRRGGRPWCSCSGRCRRSRPQGAGNLRAEGDGARREHAQGAVVTMPAVDSPEKVMVPEEVMPVAAATGARGADLELEVAPTEGAAGGDVQGRPPGCWWSRRRSVGVDGHVLKDQVPEPFVTGT